MAARLDLAPAAAIGPHRPGAALHLAARYCHDSVVAIPEMPGVNCCIALATPPPPSWRAAGISGMETIRALKQALPAMPAADIAPCTAALAQPFQVP